MDVSAVNEKHGITALHAACQPTSDRALTLLLAKPGIDVNVRNSFGSTALHVACRFSNDQSVARLLATPGINVNTRANNGWTPVMEAAGRHSVETFKLLLHDTRVDLDIKDNEGRGLEEAVGRWVSIKNDKKYDLIKEERMKRGNVQKKSDKASQEESTDIVIEKIDKINKKIEDSKQRWEKVLGKQKLEREEISEKQKLEKEEILEKQKLEREKLARKHQEEKTHQGETFKRETEVNEQHMADLTEVRNELVRDLEKINFDEGKSNDANNNDAKLKAARRALECPICLDSMKPPKKIWMCPSSHAICEACTILLQGKPCPTCKSGRVHLRAYTTEKMAEIVFDQSEV